MKCSLRFCFLSTAFLLVFVMSLLFTYSHHSIAYLDPGGLSGIHRVKLVPGYAGMQRLSKGGPYPPGCACHRCPADEAGAADWFDGRYDSAVSPVWTKDNMDLPPDVQRWWMMLQPQFKSHNTHEVLSKLFQIVPGENPYRSRDPHRCRRCAVVGNSGNLRGSGYGPEIDGHDFIMRCQRVVPAPAAQSRSPSWVLLGAGVDPALPPPLGWLGGPPAHPSTLSISGLGNCPLAAFSRSQETPCHLQGAGWLGGGYHLSCSLPRMNQAPTVGFEGDVGSRTTHHFMYPESAKNLPANVSFVLVPFKTLDLLWIASALSTGQIRFTYAPVKPFLRVDKEKVQIYNPAFFKYIHDRWTEHHGRYPSTGMLVLFFALHVCDEVNVFGFGADSRGNWHHYWENNRYAGEFRKTGVHDADFEAHIIDMLAKTSKIEVYRGN